MSEKIGLTILGKAGQEAVSKLRQTDLRNVQHVEQLDGIEISFRNIVNDQDREGNIESLRQRRNSTANAWPEGSDSNWSIWYKEVEAGTINRTVSLDWILNQLLDTLEERK